MPSETTKHVRIAHGHRPRVCHLALSFVVAAVEPRSLNLSKQCEQVHRDLAQHRRHQLCRPCAHRVGVGADPDERRAFSKEHILACLSGDRRGPRPIRRSPNRRIWPKSSPMAALRNGCGAQSSPTACSEMSARKKNTALRTSATSRPYTSLSPPPRVHRTASSWNTRHSYYSMVTSHTICYIHAWSTVTIEKLVITASSLVQVYL